MMMFCCLSASQEAAGALLNGTKDRCSAYTSQCRAGQAAVSIDSLPHAAIAKVLRKLPFKFRCQAACVCRSWAAIVKSAAAGSEEQECPSDWTATRLQPCEVDATQEDVQCQLQQCPALRYATSASIWMCAVGHRTLGRLQGVTRLHMLDVRCDVEGRHFNAQPAITAVISLQHLTKLRVLNVGMSAPMIDFGKLPSSLQCLHLNLASGYSVGQLQGTCAALAAAAPRIPHLRHISLGMELDALLRNSRGKVLNPLAALTQLTSLALVEYQYMPADSPAHEGYALLPPVLQQLPGLKQADVRLCTGQYAQLAEAAGVPDVRLVLTLARHEQVQFNRLPPSLMMLKGLTSLSILLAEFVYDTDNELFVFDASPLALCQHLTSLLLELHGMKSSQHDVRGLAQLKGLQDLVVLFKCPDVHEARPETSSSSVSGGTAAAAAAGVEPGSAGSRDGSFSGLSGWLSRTTSALRRPGSIGLVSLLHKAWAGSQVQSELEGVAAATTAATAGQRAGASSSESREEDASISLLCEEWVLQLLDTALDQLRPEFALSVPHVPGRLLLATTSRLLLRQPELVCRAAQPLLLCSHLQLDCDATDDMWSGECFLHRRSATELRAWVNRNWQPHGVQLLDAARYPQLGSYPGCRQRIDDKLLVVARKGTSGRQVVATVMDTVEERCMTYFT